MAIYSKNHVRFFGMNMVWSFRRLRGLSGCIVCSSASNLLLPRGFDGSPGSPAGRTGTGSLGSLTELTASIEGVPEGEDFEEKFLP